MSESVRQAASSSLERAREGYWFQREQKQLQAAEEGLRQVDELVRRGGDAGEAETVRLARVAAEAAVEPGERLESLRLALDVLSTGAAAGVGPQAALAVRLLTQANRQKVIDEMLAMAPADSPLMRLAGQVDSLGTSRVLMQGLAEGRPTSAADEAALVLRLARPSAGLDGLMAAWKPASSALYEEVRQAGLQDAVARPLLEGLAKGQVDRLAVLAGSVEHLEGQSVESLAKLAASRRGPWQKVLKEALAADPQIREPLCRALLERVEADRKGDDEDLLAAALEAGRQQDDVPPALTRLAVDLADRNRPASMGWYAALRGAAQAAPEVGGRILEALSGEPPPTAAEMAQQAAWLLDTASLEDGAVGVAAAFAPEVARLAMGCGDAAVQEAASVVTVLSGLPYTSGGSGMVRAALQAVPEPEDPPLTSVDPTFQAGLAKSVLSEAVSAKDREAAAFALLDGLGRVAAGNPQLSAACDLVRKAAGALRADHGQRASAASLLFEVLSQLETAAHFSMDLLLAQVAADEGLAEGHRAELARRMLGPCADALRQAGETRGADQLDILNRLISLDLDSDAARLGLLSHALSNDLPESPLGLVPQCLAGRGYGTVWADREQLLSEGLKLAAQYATPEQGRLLEVIAGLLPDLEQREGLLNLLARAPEGEGLGWACDLATMILDELLSTEAAVAFWDGLSSQLVKGRGPDDVLGRMLSQGRRDVASATDDDARLEVIRGVLERVKLVYQDEALRGLARPEADPGEIEVGDGEVTIGDVRVPRR